MSRALLVALALCACRTAAPEATPPSAATQVRPPTDWHDDPGLMKAQADANCQHEQPDCKRAFGMFWLPPSPCANQGTRCLDAQGPKNGQGHWSCDCDSCLTSADCAAGERCATTAPPCEDKRAPFRCLAGPPLPPGPCPEKKPPP